MTIKPATYFDRDLPTAGFEKIFGLGVAVGPINTVAPTLSSAGTLGKIGDEATIDPGTWDDANEYRYRWIRDQAQLGITTAAYTPQEPDDLYYLRGEVSARKDTGPWSGWASSATQIITYKAPQSAGNLGGHTLIVGALTSIDFGAQVSVTGDANLSGGVFTVQGGAVPGMTINATTGVYAGTPTDTQAEATTTIRYTNSGGTVDVTDAITVSVSARGPEQITSWGASASSDDQFAAGIFALPHPGDDDTGGDDAGTLTDLQYRINGGSWISFADPDFYSVSEDDPELLIENAATTVTMNGNILEIDYAQS